MRPLIILILAIMPSLSFGQDKYNYVHFNKLIEIEGTDFVIATIENLGKTLTASNRYLLFINTKDGQSRQIDFPKDAYIEKIQQVRMDSLGINKVIVSARTINLDKNKTIDWNDPQQIIILSPDAREKTQLTEDNFFTSTWSINRRTGSIVIAGHYDSNQNSKYDKTDKNEILIYDLTTFKLIAKI